MRARPHTPLPRHVRRSAVRGAGLATFALCCVGSLLFACRPAPRAFPASLNSQYADVRLRAVRQAVDHPYDSPEERRTVLEMLVERLDDEDAAVRFFSIVALEKMTGTRLGYEYHDDLHERLRAIEAWRRYLAQEAGRNPTEHDNLRQTAGNPPPGRPTPNDAKNGGGGNSR